MKTNSKIRTNILVREADATDAEAILHLIQQLASDSEEQSPITKDYVLDYLGTSNSRVLLAECNGIVNGLLSYSIHPDLYHAGSSGLIEELVVDENYRGEGLGSALITALMDRLKRLDCKEICLAVMPDNERAIRFYRSHGLVEEALFLEKHF